MRASRASSSASRRRRPNTPDSLNFTERPTGPAPFQLRLHWPEKRGPPGRDPIGNCGSLVDRGLGVGNTEDALSEGGPMSVPTGLNHVAMSVPSGTLVDRFRAELLEFYGSLFGWSEIESLRLPDRLTVSIGRHCYLNVRERPDPMVCSGYEHIGIVDQSR